MTDFFFDTSALVKRYISEVGTAWVKSLTRAAANNVIIVSQITPVEVVAAIQKRQRQGVNNRGISAGSATNARLLFRKDSPRFYFVSLTPAIFRAAERLPLRYKLRAYDAVQLACALEAEQLLRTRGLPSLVFLASDNELLAAAQAEGLATDNPDAHP